MGNQGSAAQSEYPKRERFFAQRFIRLLSKTCAAQEIGVDAVWLLTVIASQEDAARYKRAVTFYNDQLRSICGFGTWRRLDNARKIAMESGWLHYEPCDAGKRRAGRYWVSIPSFAEDLDDSAISDPPHIHYVECAQGQTEKAADTMPSAHSEAHSEAHNEAHNYLTLTLIPNPKEECFAAQSYSQKPTPDAASEKRGGKPKPCGEDFFKAFIDRWNDLPSGIAPRISKPDSPTLAKCWNHAWRNAEVREWLKKPDEVIAMIRGSPGVHRQTWFCFAWLLKREKVGSELNMLKLMEGRYRERIGKQKQLPGPGQVHDSSTARRAGIVSDF